MEEMFWNPYLQKAEDKYTTKYMREQRAEWKAQGKCFWCGADVQNGRKKCINCLEKERINRMKTRDYRRENGLCVHCGRRKATDGYVSCEKCRKSINFKRLMKRRKLKKEQDKLKKSSRRKNTK